MAPEVIRNEACSEKVDIYSFGIIFSFNFNLRRKIHFDLIYKKVLCYGSC